MKNANKVPPNKKNGFSVLEMGITLTIISLLIAAILTGQNVKHRQELTQVITDMGTITSAVTQFKTTYGNYYPGDLYNATESWGQNKTTNGDGSGFLETPGTRNEELLFWQHLTLSGLLSSTLSGSYDGTNVTGEGGVMVSSLPYGFYYAHKALNNPSAVVNPNGKLLIQVSKTGSAGIFTTKEAYNLDAKYDNTAPLTTASGTLGTIWATDGSTQNCVDTTTTPPTYKLTNTTGTPCVLHFSLE